MPKMMCQPVERDATKRIPLAIAVTAVCARRARSGQLGAGVEALGHEVAHEGVVGDDVAHDAVDERVGRVKVALDPREVVGCARGSASVRASSTSGRDLQGDVETH